MGRRVRILSALVAGTLAFVVGSSTAHALSGDRLKCQKGIAKEAGKYVNGKLKVLQKCLNANLGAPGTCTAPDANALAKLVDKLNAGLDKACSFPDFPGTDDDNLAVIGFPGPCGDVNPLNGFNVGDLKACILSSHDTIISGVCGGGSNTSQSCNVLADCPDTGPGTFCRGFVNTEYDPTVVLPLGADDIKCQKEVGKAGAKFVAALMKSIQKCRNALLDCKTVGNSTVCKLSGLSPQACAVNDPKTADAVTKAREKAIAAITKKCAVPPADLGVLKLCDPDQGTTAAAATCEADVHQDLVDNDDSSAIPDLIDYQYAQRGVCGDNRRNQASEECDGTDDSACPGQCGGSLGFFPCLCQNTPRTRVVEHANADLDNGWSGQSHDSGIVEGGGYVADLWDCDGPGGPDTECVVGPSCALPPHQACSPGRGTTTDADAICTGVGNFCRTTSGGATGPHCEIDFTRRCQSQNECNSLPGDRCVEQLHGAPLPLVAGGVAVCVVNTFTEDVVGTTDLASGASSVRLRQDSATFPGGSTQQPCPVCGGFCSGPGSQSGPETRTLCTSDAQCDGGRTCVLENICSWGPDFDKPCRPNPPFGGPTQFFGNPSKDCRRATSNGAAFGVIDILFNPATTGPTTRTANSTCGSPAPPGFAGKTCAGGTNQHAPCTVASECPGGTCNNQCFCPSGPDTQRPNGCQAACLGGASDAQPCVDNIDCPGGFCHPADCRLNPSDTDSAQEGLCTVGPSDNTCSVNTFLACEVDADCQPPNCAFCGVSETCVANQRQCFVNPTIQRTGVPGTPDRTTAAIFCITPTGSDAVDGVAGLPGPGAITQPATTIEVGF